MPGTWLLLISQTFAELRSARALGTPERGTRGPCPTTNSQLSAPTDSLQDKAPAHRTVPSTPHHLVSAPHSSLAPQDRVRTQSCKRTTDFPSLSSSLGLCTCCTSCRPCPFPYLYFMTQFTCHLFRAAPSDSRQNWPPQAPGPALITSCQPGHGHLRVRASPSLEGWGWGASNASLRPAPQHGAGYTMARC